jgi:hypothetical protein
MNLDAAKALNEAATQSAKDQIELNRTSLENQLDAVDRMILRKAADTTIELANLATAAQLAGAGADPI